MNASHRIALAVLLPMVVGIGIMTANLALALADIRSPAAVRFVLLSTGALAVWTAERVATRTIDHRAVYRRGRKRLAAGSCLVTGAVMIHVLAPLGLGQELWSPTLTFLDVLRDGLLHALFYGSVSLAPFLLLGSGHGSDRVTRSIA